MSLLRRVATVLGLVAAMAVRQVRAQPFRTYLAARLGTLVAASAAGAFGLWALRPTLLAHAGSRHFVPLLAAVLTGLGLLLLAARLFAHRWLNVGSLREVFTPEVRPAARALLLRSLPVTCFVVLLALMLGPWTFSPEGAAAWLGEAGPAEMAAAVAGTTVLGWWSLGPDSEAAAGAILWPEDRRPLRFFPRRYRPIGEAGRRATARLLDLPAPMAGLLHGDEGAPTDREAVHRRLLGHALSELASRLASAAPEGELSELVRRPLPALDGASVLALVRRAADPADPLTVGDVLTRVGGLTRRDLAPEPSDRPPVARTRPERSGSRSG